MKKLLVCLIAGLFAAPASAALVLYNQDKPGFDGATSGLAFEGFETATLNSATEVGFAGGTFSCSGTSFCPGFFGISAIFSASGSQSVFFATPDTATFTFDSAINAFGVVMGGAGNVGILDLFATTSEGDMVQILDDFVGPNVTELGGFEYFFGLVDDMMTYTSVTISATNTDDGIFFDELEFGTVDAGQMPEPSSIALLGLGLAGLGFARKKQ